jgi:hypothetical protein
MTRTLAVHPTADIAALLTLFFTSGALTGEPDAPERTPRCSSLIALHARIFGALETHVAPALLPTLARFLFVAVLFLYYWNSGLTKLGDGLFGLFSLDRGLCPDPASRVRRGGL